MKEVFHAESGCKRELLMKSFGFNPVTDIKIKHTCCDKCAEECGCGEDCKARPGLLIPDKTNMEGAPQQIRPVNCDQKKMLEAKLNSFRDELIKEHKVNIINTVTLPTCLLEFERLQILHIIRNCHKIFCISITITITNLYRG